MRCGCSSARTLATAAVVCAVIASAAAPCGAIFLPMSTKMAWFDNFMKSLGGQAPAGAFQAQQAPAGGLASGATPAPGDASVLIELGPMGAQALQLVEGQPSAFPILVTNNGAQAVNLTFGIIETPPAEGEPIRSIEPIGVRPIDDVPSMVNPYQLTLAPQSSTDAEMALFTPAGSLPASADGRETAVTVTARDEDGVILYAREPLVVNVLRSQAAQGEPGCVPVEQVLSSNGYTNTFAAAWRAADLGQYLAEGGPYSILAPTDEAFAQLTSELGVTEQELLASPSLKTLLLHHVVPGRLNVEELVRTGVAQTSICSQVAVGVRDSLVTVDGCVLSISEEQVCGHDLYTLGCVLPAPEPGQTSPDCTPVDAEGAPGFAPVPVPVGGPQPPANDNPFGSSPVDDYYDYDYNFENIGDFLPAAAGGALTGAGAGLAGSPSANGPQDPLSAYTVLTPVLPRQTIPGEQSRADRLAAAGDEGVKATFLPPGWQDWITPGDLSCYSPGLATAASAGAAPGSPGQCALAGCDQPGAFHSCGYLQSTGPRSYQVQPPPEAFTDGYLTFDDTYAWQARQGGSGYCTPPSQDGESFQGSVYHEAWVEPRNPGSLDAMLFLLQNSLEGEAWQVVGMQGSPAEDTQGVKTIKTLGQGCFMWVVASAEGSGPYDFHLVVSQE